MLILSLACVLAGCGKSRMPEVSSVSIGKDGGIVHQIVGELDRDYYEMDSLKTMASDRVTEYCDDNGEGSVTLGDVTEKDGRVLIQINYSTGEDYSAFNHRELYVGSLEEADEQGYQLEGVAFISPDGKPTEFGYMEGHDTTQIVIVATKPSEELVVNTYGKVLYINQSATSDLDVSFLGKKGVRIVHPAGEENEGGSTLSYIVFQ